MAVFERIREFGLVKSLGMKPVAIVAGVLVESFLILVMGIAVGNGLGFLTLSWISTGGIDLSALAAGTEMVGMSRTIFPQAYPRDVVGINLVVFLLGLLVSVYPAVKAAGITPIEAMAHQ
jgi:ABC-type lipoprotein release transport system permease subunit